MASKFILTDGLKATNLLNSDDPSVWTYFSNAPPSDMDVLYARVAAAFRAFNLKANTVGGMPFILYEGKKEYDNTATWKNECGFLPNPSELLRLNTLSYMVSNTVYNLRTSNILGERTKGLYHAIPYSFRPITNGQGTDIDRIERTVGTTIERYQYPFDKRLVRMWRLDHTTELLPSPNTEARAIMNAAGEIYFADLWIKHFYQRGGIKPTLIAMKGMISNEAKDEKEKSWSDFIRGVRTSVSKFVRIFNAETMDIQAFGSGVDDLKNNDVYQQAISNIAMGTGMPLSLLLANSANYATAKEEKATWYENDIIPLCNWMAYEYNRQVFEPIGLRMEFHPETLDPQQEDETERAQAINTFMDFLAKCPTFEIFQGTCDTFGYELAESLITAAEKYYADKEAQAEETRLQMQGAGVVLDADGKPVAQAEPGEEVEEEEDEEKKPFPPAKWIPSLDQLRELQRWQERAFRSLKRGETPAFEWRNDTLPADVFTQIKARLDGAGDEGAIKAAFDVDVQAETQTPAPAYKIETIMPDPSILQLAAAMNRLADTAVGQGVKSMDAPNVNITMSPITLTAQMPEQGSVIVNVPEQPAPIVNVTNEVNPTPVTIENKTTVKPAPVNVIEKGKRVAKVKRNADGKITEITADEA